MEKISMKNSYYKEQKSRYYFNIIDLDKPKQSKYQDK